MKNTIFCGTNKTTGCKKKTISDARVKRLLKKKQEKKKVKT